MKVLGAVLIVLALVVAIVPQFTDCLSQGQTIALPNGSSIPMKCHWTARAELAMGVPIAFVGGMMAFSRRKQSLQVLSVMGIVLGAGTMLLPSELIGVCGNPEMICNTLMKPVLLFAGGLVTAGSVVGLLSARNDGLEDLG